MTILYQFPLSHYCEKIRWALEFKGLEYKVVNSMPGAHFLLMKKLKVPNKSVPVLEHNGKLIQNSSDIITYLDETFPDNPLTPSNEEERKEALEWELWADEEIGVHLRRCGYNILLKEKKTLISYLTSGNPWYAPMLMKVLFPILKKKMIELLDITDQTAIESKERLEAALRKVDTRLKNREFIVGDQFSRADLTVASLAAPLFFPDNYGFTPKVKSTKLEEFSQKLREHAQWVPKFYLTNR